jgi:hypothetical protein
MGQKIIGVGEGVALDGGGGSAIDRITLGEGNGWLAGGALAEDPATFLRAVKNFLPVTDIVAETARLGLGVDAGDAAARCA